MERYLWHNHKLVEILYLHVFYNFSSEANLCCQSGFEPQHHPRLGRQGVLAAPSLATAPSTVLFKGAPHLLATPKEDDFPPPYVPPTVTHPAPDSVSEWPGTQGPIADVAPLVREATPPPMELVPELLPPVRSPSPYWEGGAALALTSQPPIATLPPASDASTPAAPFPFPQIPPEVGSPKETPRALHLQ